MKRTRKYEGLSLVLKKQREKAWRDKNRLEGLCSCGKTLSHEKKRCQKCIDESNAKRKERRDLRKQNKICIECSSPTDGKILCTKCNEIHKTLIKNVKQKRIEEKICVRCGTEKSIHNLQNCLTCVLKCLAFELWNDRKKWQDLLELFTQQKGICPYFKESISIGLDASLDHRVPKKIGGSNDISNLQWIHKIVNTMKWDLTEEEFYSYVEKLHKGIE